MARDTRFVFVLSAALAICLPLTAQAQGALAPAAAAAASPPAASPPAASPPAAAPPAFSAPAQDVTGAIPGQDAASLTPGSNDGLGPSLPGALTSHPAPPPNAGTPQEAPPAVPNAASQNVAPAAPPKPPLTGLAAAVKKALAAWQGPHGRGRHAAELWLEHKDIADYYAARDYAPLWVENGMPIAAVAPIRARLAQAAEDGLDLAGLPRADFSGDTDALAAAEIAFSEEIVAYGRQASGCRIDPRDINPLIGAKPDVAAPALILATVAAAGMDGGNALQRFNPQQKPYLALRAKLNALRRRDGTAAARMIPPGVSLRPGMSDPRVPLIRARLGLDVAQDDSDLVYDTQLAAAVADFQRANGLRPSGIFTRRTLDSLDAGRQRKDVEDEILANMETWRWMPRTLGQNRIDVNIPDFEVRVIRDGNVVLKNKVIVGKPDTPTPVFSNTMKFVIVNPYWNVPTSILRKEMLPHLARDPDYFARMGFQTFYDHGRLVVRQPPGEKNALGRIKFMFPNHYAVYLHDTPERRLFGARKRAFSHGCVRVDEPFDFAQTVLGPRWPEQRLKELIGDKQRYIFLPKPLPIHLEYFTAYVDGAGHLILRHDVYGYEHRIEKALGLIG